MKYTLFFISNTFISRLKLAKNWRWFDVVCPLDLCFGKLFPQFSRLITAIRSNGRRWTIVMTLTLHVYFKISKNNRSVTWLLKEHFIFPRVILWPHNLLLNFELNFKIIEKMKYKYQYFFCHRNTCTRQTQSSKGQDKRNWF